MSSCFRSISFRGLVNPEDWLEALQSLQINATWTGYHFIYSTALPGVPGLRPCCSTWPENQRKRRIVDKTWKDRNTTKKGKTGKEELGSSVTPLRSYMVLQFLLIGTSWCANPFLIPWRFACLLPAWLPVGSTLSLHKNRKSPSQKLLCSSN